MTAHRSLDASNQPSLAQLVQDELRRDDTAVDPSRLHRRGSDPTLSGPPSELRGDIVEPPTPSLRSVGSTPALPHKVPPSAPFLLPPHYGRPGRPSSPDVLAALLRPVLASLSRPSSPAVSPSTPGTPAPTSPTRPSPSPSSSPAAPRTRTPPESVPLDRSSSSLPAQFPPREPTDPAPTVESQGFVLYVGSLVAFGAYLVWAVVPDAGLEAMGVEWYPARDWALLVPSWIVMLVAFVYSSYFCLNLYNTPPLSSSELLDDPRAFVPPPPRPPRAPTPLWAHSVLLEQDAIPPLYDLPVEVVNRVLYGEL
ncbi:PIG-P-domain-containing protein [Rhodotorula diobovata]|uniref:PIG-P-domain-containing protein n=1 Tax=Rhodotorula diobovata TaxID=5288 RepID=A0A5C5FQS8_9BASI|nr:PIG-P-domain-containing protein [Rhodotorula diobovata]